MADKKTAVMQSLWKAAHRNGSVVIPLKTPSDAKSTRWGLYNSVAAVRKDPSLDRALALAVEECEIRWVNDRTLEIRIRMPSEELLAAALAAGIDTNAVSEAPKDEIELAAVESQRRLEELMKGTTSPTAPAHRPNKYFDRSEG